eukprot:g8325.t1
MNNNNISRHVGKKQGFWGPNKIPGNGEENERSHTVSHIILVKHEKYQTQDEFFEIFMANLGSFLILHPSRAQRKLNERELGCTL